MGSFMKKLKAGAKMIANHPIVKQAVTDMVEQGKANAIGRIGGISAYRRGGRVARVRKYRRGGRVSRSCSCKH